LSRITEIKKIDDKNERYAAINDLSVNGLDLSELQELIDFFSDAYWPIREAAAKKLGSLGSEATAYLANAISASNDDVRFWTSQVLAGIADEAAIKLLISSFTCYEENDINLYSARALIKIGASAEPFLRQALDSPNDLIRLYSLYCLGEIRSNKSLSPIHKLLKNDHNFAIRKNAAIAAGKIHDELSIEHLIEAISDKSWYVRVAAAEALGKFKRGSDILELSCNPGGQKKDFTERIASTLLASLSDTEARVRETGAKVLSEMGEKFATDHLLKLLENSNSEGEKLIAIRSLGDRAATDAVESLTRLLQSTESRELKKEAIKALGKTGGKSATEAIARYVMSENTDIATMAIFALFETRNPDALSMLSALLEENREEIRAATLAAISKNDYFDLRHYLYTGLEDSSYLVRRQALLSLYNLLGDEIISEAISMINDSDEFVASEAISIAAKIKNPDAIPAISKLIERGSNRLAYMAFQSLADIGPDAEYVILKNLSSSNNDICYWAIGTLEKIGSPACVRPLLDVIKKHSGSQEVVERALNVLLQFDFEIDDEFFIEVLNNLKSSQDKAIELIGKSHNPEVALKILPYLSDREKQVRFQMAVTLGRLKSSNEKVINALIESFKDRHWPVRKASAEALAAIGEDAIKRLIAVLDAERVNADVVYWSLRALSETRSEKAIATYKKYIQTVGADVKKIIIKGLGKIGNDECLDLLVSHLNDKDPEIRFHTVKSLRGCKNAKLASHLIEKMKDEYENVRSFAAIALGNFNSTEAIAALKCALNDQSHWVVKYAKESLAKLMR